MNRRLGVLSAAFFGVTLAGCGGHGALTPGVPSQANGGAPRTDPRAAMLQQAFLDQLKAGAISRANLPEDTRKNAEALTLVRSQLPGSQLSSVGANGSGSFGYIMNPGGQYTGIFAEQSVYSGSDFVLIFPPGPSSSSGLMAPMSYPPNGSCLISGTLYASTAQQSTNDFSVIDVCTAQVHNYLIESNFKRNFIRNSPYGVPSYWTITYTPDGTPNATSTWHTLVYNFFSVKWVDLQDAKGVGVQSSGFETFNATKLAQGPCPSIPAMGASELALYDAKKKMFEPLKPTMNEGSTTKFFVPGTGGQPKDCFTNDGTNTPSYEYVQLGTNGWQVEARQQVTVYTAGLQTSSTPWGLARGPDENLWFSDRYGGANGAYVGRITPLGTITQFQVDPPANAFTSGIAPGPDGNIWFTEHLYVAPFSKIGVITPKGVAQLFSSTSISQTLPESIVSGPDGNLWFTTLSSSIGRITTAGAITVIPFTDPSGGGASESITAGPDGNLWFTDANGFIGRMTTAGVATFYPSQLAGPITNGPDGNLWFTGYGANQIGRITPTGVVTLFPTAPAGAAFAITTGIDGNLWFDDLANLGRMTPAGVVTEFPVSGSAQNGIISGPEGNLWYTTGGGIGRFIP